MARFPAPDDRPGHAGRLVRPRRVRCRSRLAIAEGRPVITPPLFLSLPACPDDRGPTGRAARPARPEATIREDDASDPRRAAHVWGPTQRPASGGGPASVRPSRGAMALSSPTVLDVRLTGRH